MPRRGWALLVVVAASCAPPPAVGDADDPEPGVGIAREAVGEPQNGFPRWEERVILVWVNRARSDPQADLAGCSSSACGEKACYSAQPPLLYSYTLNRSARFHSANLESCGAFDHPSPCTVVSNINTLYSPGSCNGAASCGCTGGSCSCGSGGCTNWDARISLFGGSPTGENIAENSNNDPVTIFYQWLWESSSTTSCTFTEANGHRMNILTQTGAIGIGFSGNTCTQDFGGPASASGKIIAGAHYPATGTVAFRANWYDSAGAPQQAAVNIDGTCHLMTKERGVAASNATYLLDGQSLSGCHHYFFTFKDAGGASVYYPDTGSFGVGCSADWDTTRPASGAGCGCTPSCGGKQCGDDGCGGTCVPGCSGAATCQAGQCVCATTTCGTACCNTGESCYQGACCAKQCAGKQCGPDGCGGSCGTCAGSLACESAGSCGCQNGLTACGTACVNTQSDFNNCGGCSHPCTAPQVCAAGSCSATCQAGYDNCSGSCADLQTDATHCGRCDLACSPGATCAAGKCVCPGGLMDCPGAGCTDVATDPSNCGSCGRECLGCAAGHCPGDGADGGTAANGELRGGCGCRSDAGPDGVPLALLGLGLAFGRGAARRLRCARPRPRT